MRKFAMLLSLTLVAGLVSCNTAPGSPGITTPVTESDMTGEMPSSLPAIEAETSSPDHEELDRVITLGLAPGELLQKPDSNVTHAEFCTMLSTVIEKLYGTDILQTWQDTAALALSSDMPMNRGDGAMAIFEAALITGMDDYHSNGGMQIDIDSTTSGTGIYGMREREDYPLFPNWREPYYNRNWDEPYDNLADGAVRYSWHRKSAVSGRTIMEFDENLSMRYDDPFTVEEAACAALRLYESWVPRQYVKPDDPSAIAYNPSLITDDLLHKNSQLPVVTQQNLPASWKGLCIYSKGVTHNNIAEAFRERDIRFLSENGFNFARVFLGFTTLGYPDFPEDGAVVNLAELEDLDRCISWGLQYDIHISLCMLTPPGYASQEDVEHQAIKDHDYPSKEQWQLIEQYWVMLARRYADIPSKNLSFELCTEWHLDKRADDFQENWKPIIQSITAISLDRVLLASFDTALPMKLELAEDMASMGISLAAHPYNPWQVTRGNTDVRADFGFTGELSWPLTWFPSGDFNKRISPITINGTVGGTTLTAYVLHDGMAWEDESGKPSITVYADDTAIATHTFTAGGAPDPLTVDIPSGTREVTLKHTSGYLELSCLRFDGTFGSAEIMPHDLGWSMEAAGPANLLLDDNGKWADADQRLYDGETFYQEELLPYIEIAEKYNVGFMVNEFVFADDEQDTTTPLQLDAHLKYYGDAIQTFQTHDVGFVLDFVVHGSTGILRDSPGFEMWSRYPGYLSEQTYTFENRRTDHFYINKTLLDLITSYFP